MESQPNVMEIFQALKSDDLDFIKSLYTLDSKKDPIFSYIPNPSIPLIFRNNSPLLSVASFYGSHQCIDYLLQISSTIDIKDASKFPMTPLHYAIAGNKLKTVKHLLSLHSSPIGILYFSIIFDRIKILQYSLENQIEPIDSKFNGETALSTSRDIGNSLFIALLIANGAEDVVSKISINALTSNGDTPLMFAARRGSLPIVKFILQHEGVDVNQANKGGIFLVFLRHLYISLL
ncbi:ankyrin repeats (3 copies) domain-containing protein [Histomonas meleagridis]|uniref:ankyrin repeats (3 copies) domain-containing protein n=1 Tax=Histomonas meleagridis TaxID=135588 RepID=UPI00355A2D22|nr:ankyrin repeats (3 copies) domain-containing protein [Histomonas meleagridis]KAH0802606.1 ankyrin repeats (3 copies) domain-containing protein [Histomonas meleagridis]